MHAQVVIGAVRDAHQLVPLLLLVFTLREKAVQNIDRALGVMGQFLLWLARKAQFLGRDAERLEPRLKAVDPFLMDPRRVLGPAEIFHLHLLELAGAKDEIARRDLVAKRLADLGDAERQLAARRVRARSRN